MARVDLCGGATVNSRGFSLIEILIVLAVLSLLVVGAFVIHRLVQPKAQASDDRSMVEDIVANMQALFGSSGGIYVDGSNVVMPMNNAFLAAPQSFGGGWCDPAADTEFNAGGCFAKLSDWGDPITIGESQWTGGHGLTVYFWDIPPDKCVDLLSGGATASGAAGVSNGQDYNAELVPIAHPMTNGADIAAFCSANADPEDGGDLDYLILLYPMVGTWPTS